jgi:geranylgeranyl diphosphate synthase, type II
VSGGAAANHAGSVLENERAPVNAALDRFVSRGLAGIDRRVAEPIAYALRAGGKRLRPILCVTAYRAVRGEPPAPEGYDAACAIELVHTYSLVHDDLPCMDDDALRRGQPTTHRVFGETAAVIAGAALIPLACAHLDAGATALGLNPAARAATLAELTRGAGAAGMVGGQMLDLEAEGRTVALGELQAIHARKTGALFVSALRIGGRLAGAGDTVLDALGQCGRKAGLAFQVADDILDVTGSDAVLGKSAGRDREHGKATYPALMGLEAAREHAAAAVVAAIAALHGAGIRNAALESLIAFAVERDR